MKKGYEQAIVSTQHAGTSIRVLKRCYREYQKSKPSETHASKQPHDLLRVAVPSHPVLDQNDASNF